MIRQLSIQGLAIIDTLDIDFTPGFNVITGETGAGKSILIKALSFLTGARLSTDVVRTGWDFGTVAGEFSVPVGHRVMGLLTELGIEAESEDDLITVLLRRQIHAKGRSQAWINDVPVAVPSLRSVGTALLDVFVQHENQRLLNPSEHIQYVDSFLDEPATRERVRQLGKACSEIVGEMTEILSEVEQTRRQSDYLSFRDRELKDFAPSVEDYEKTRTYCDQAESFRKHRDPIAQALQILEGEQGESPSQLSREVAKHLAPPAAQDAKLKELEERALACAREIDDIGYELGRLLAGQEFDEERLEECQQRLFGYQDLFRKHSVRDVESLLAEVSRLSEQLQIIASAESRLEESLAKLWDDSQSLQRESEKLSVARLQAALCIKDHVERELADLHMPGSVFQIDFTPVEKNLPDLRWEGFSSDLAQKWERCRAILSTQGEGGFERAQFSLSANAGEPPMALAKVASGGELSRIMLALKKALAADAETCVLVFDEIDTGISGRVADVVGRKMRELSGGFQVICISHLAQVAVYADTHFLVTKKGTGDRIQSSIIPLTKEQSAKEIARLLSGREVSPTSLANAKNLIASARCKAPKTGLPLSN